jgi:dTDP-glucose 4,6-dehydratase
MKVLVTGADGFIGSHLVEALVKKDYDVRAFVLYNSFDSCGWLDNCSTQIKEKFEVFRGDVRDPNGVREALKGCDLVIHLAALIAIPYSYHSPDSYVDTNIKGTLNILQAARDRGTRVIHTSTSEVYGSAQVVPITEEHPLQGQSPYSATKIASDQLAFSFFSSFDLPVTIIRPFNTYGPRQSARAVIPAIISQLLAGAEIINLGSLHPTRDFNFVLDTVNGFISAINAPNAYGEFINIGSNFEISIGDTVNLIANIMGKNVDIKEDEQRLRPINSEVERLWASNQKAKELLNWEPDYAGLEGLERGLRSTIDWFSRPENLERYSQKGYSL